MKKTIMIAVAIFTISAAFSQEGMGKTFSIGPSVGFGHTGIRNTAGTDLFKPAWSAGVIVNYSTSEHIGFAGDVLFSAEGARTEWNRQETDISMQYIRVPLKFAYFFGAFEDDFRPKLTIGPSMGFLLNADADVEGVGKSDVTSSYNMFDMGVNASAGFNWKVADNMWLNTDLNYYTGFIPVRGDQYNSNLGLKLGLAFGL